MGPMLSGGCVSVGPVLLLVACLLTVAGAAGCVPTGAARGRVRIVDNVVVADNWALLRGENPRWNSGRRNDPAFWARLRDEFHMNTVRILCYQPPQNWEYGGKKGPGWDFDAAAADQMIPALDEWIDAAEREGFYAIIDYHPVGGHGEDIALAWWSAIAGRYADRTSVIYEACNEPVAWRATEYSDDDVAFQRTIYRHIRRLAPDTHIILWSFPNGDPEMVDTVAKAKGIDYTNASVGWHIYDCKLEGIRRLREAYPMIQTEIGGKAAAAYNEGATLCEQHGISWIVLDGAMPAKAVDVTWEGDPYFSP